MRQVQSILVHGIRLFFLWITFQQWLQAVMCSSTAGFAGATDILADGNNACNRKVQFDLYYLQENTASFLDDVSALVWELPVALQHITDIYPGSRIGLGLFKDESSSNKTYSTRASQFSHILGLSTNFEKFQHTIKTTFWPAKGDHDLPQDSFRAMVLGALHVDASAPRARVHDSESPVTLVRVVLLVTDNIAHVKHETVYPTEQWGLADGYKALHNRSPTFSEVKRVLTDTKVVPIVLTTEDNLSFWEPLVSRLSPAGVVAGLADNSSNLSEAIATVLAQVACLPKSALPVIYQPAANVTSQAFVTPMSTAVPSTVSTSHLFLIGKPETTSMAPTNRVATTSTSIAVATKPVLNVAQKPQRNLFRSISAKPSTLSANPATLSAKPASVPANPNSITPKRNTTKSDSHTLAVNPATVTSKATTVRIKPRTTTTKVISITADLTTIASDPPTAEAKQTTTPRGVMSPLFVTSFIRNTSTEFSTTHNTTATQILNSVSRENVYEYYLPAIAASGGVVILGMVIIISVTLRKKLMERNYIREIRLESLTFSKEDPYEKDVFQAVEDGDFFLTDKSTLP